MNISIICSASSIMIYILLFDGDSYLNNNYFNFFYIKIKIDINF